MSTKTIGQETQEDRDGYYQFQKLVADRIAALSGPLFTTELPGPVTSLWSLYLDGLPGRNRQHYNCAACRRFVERYAGLVRIAADGLVFPALFGSLEGVPLFFRDAVAALGSNVGRARVNGVFVNDAATWGTPQTGAWTHLSGMPAGLGVFRNPLKNASQQEAEKKEDYAVLQRSLADFSVEAIEQAVRVLSADALYRSEKADSIAKWFLDLKKRVEAAKISRRPPTKDNLVWLAVATAPPGFCHVRTTVLGTLLEDVAAGYSFDAIARRWAAKLHPLQYQRPTALSEGVLRQAEETVAKLGAAGSLARRFAAIEDVLGVVGFPVVGRLFGRDTPAWFPRFSKGTEYAAQYGASTETVFGHLRARAKGTAPPVRPLELPPETVSWRTFEEDVLPHARWIECLVPTHRAPFTALVTAVNPEAPPILQWDGLTEVPCTVCRGGGETPVEGSSTIRAMCKICGGKGDVYYQRNPVSWYLYNGGSTAEKWGLRAGEWVDVLALTENPAHWQGKEQFKHEGRFVLILLDGCRDDYSQGKSGGLFPECLRSEYHGIRKAMEAHAREAAIAPAPEGKAPVAGLMFNGETPRTSGFRPVLRVSRDGGDVRTYTIDRWK